MVQSRTNIQSLVPAARADGGVVVVDGAGCVRRWNAEALDEIDVVAGSAVVTAAASHRSQVLLGDSRGRIAVLGSGADVPSWHDAHSAPVTCLTALSGRIPLLVSADATGEIRVARMAAPEQAVEVLPRLVGSVVCMAALRGTSGASFMACGSGEGDVSLWNCGTWNLDERRSGIHDGRLWDMAVLPKDHGRRAAIVTAGDDGVITVLEAAGLAERARLLGHEGQVRTVLTVLDREQGRTLVLSGGQDGTLRVWSPHNGRLLRTIDVAAPVTALAGYGHSSASAGACDPTYVAVGTEAGLLLLELGDELFVPHAG
jgi:WD40 repeat protein